MDSLNGKKCKGHDSIPIMGDGEEESDKILCFFEECKLAHEN
jgi:hypothetical protein